MRILFVTSMHPTIANPQRGVIVARLAEALRAIGHEVELFPLGHQGGPIRYVKARSRFAATVHSYVPDVIHVHFGYSGIAVPAMKVAEVDVRSEEHTSELQSQSNLVCRLLLEKKKKK